MKVGTFLDNLAGGFYTTSPAKAERYHNESYHPQNDRSSPFNRRVYVKSTKFRHKAGLIDIKKL
jgi:hypothetical protein